jgi:hypothetical protein
MPLTPETLRNAMGAALNALHLQKTMGTDPAEQLRRLAESGGTNEDPALKDTLHWFADCLNDNRIL